MEERPHPARGGGGLKLAVGEARRLADEALGGGDEEEVRKRVKLSEFDAQCSKVTPPPYPPHPPPCAQIEDGLFVSGERVAKDLDLLRANGVTHVVNCAGHTSANAFARAVTYATLFLSDNPNESVAPYLYDVLDLIADVKLHNGAVLVHCTQVKHPPSLLSRRDGLGCCAPPHCAATPRRNNFAARDLPRRSCSTMELQSRIDPP
jgi:hypothetical protein